MYHPRLKGNHYDMGFHYGEILYKSGQDFNNYINLSEEEIKFGKESIVICEKYAKEIMEEIKGLAEGSHTPYEKMAFWLMGMYGFGHIHGCTCFAFNDLGKTILCRDSDMFRELKDNSESVLYMPTNGYVFLGNTTSFIQMEDGMNECGLAVGINFLLTKDYKPGLNTGFVVRLILEKCKDVTEAIKLIKALPLCSTQNFILADRNNHLAVVEASVNKVVVRESNNYIVSANHFINPIMVNECIKVEDNWYKTNDRYNTAINALKEDNKNLQFAFDLASGKKGFICQYDKNINFDTLWSSIYDISDMKVYRTEGNPSKIKYEEDNRLLWGISKKYDNIKIKRIKRSDYNLMLDLVYEVFIEFEAVEYDKESCEVFYNNIHDQDYLNSVIMYGAYLDDEIVGVIGTRNNGNHIALFFVKGIYHKKGIGRKLFNEVLNKCKEEVITVNSSLYAKEIYHKLGFIDTDKEQNYNGIRFIPMKKIK